MAFVYYAPVVVFLFVYLFYYFVYFGTIDNIKIKKKIKFTRYS